MSSSAVAEKEPALTSIAADLPSATLNLKGSTGYGAWIREVAPRLGTAGGVIGIILVNSTMPQVVSTSDGRMPKLSAGVWARMACYITPKAAGLKFVQYGVMREMKLTMDNYIPAGASTMLAFGVVGTFFQSIIYNTLIADMYKIHMGVAKPKLDFKQLARGLQPGFVWCFGRECFSMGGGLWLGPYVTASVKKTVSERGMEVPDYPLRFSCGFLSGSITAFATQWLHNTTLFAGRLAAVEEPVGAPYYTRASLMTAWHEMGPRMFWANYPQRMCLIAGAVGLMNMVDIFHRPDLLFVRGCR